MCSTVADVEGFQGFHGNPLLKFIYSNRAVRLKYSNYSSFIRNHPVINVYYRERSMKVDVLFFLSFGLQLKLSWRLCQAETETPFQKSWIRHCSIFGLIPAQPAGIATFYQIVQYCLIKGCNASWLSNYL